jgi:hypothetical protein
MPFYVSMPDCALVFVSENGLTLYWPVVLLWAGRLPQAAGGLAGKQVFLSII